MTELTEEANPAVLRIREGLRRRRWILIGVTVVVIAAALAYSLTRPDEYSARATLLFRDIDFSQSVLGTSVLPDSSNPTRQAATDRRLAGLSGVYEAAARELKVSKATMRDAIALEPSGDADLLDVVAVRRSPAAAARFANTFAQTFIAGRQAADRAKLTEAQQVVQGQLAQLSSDELRSTEGRSLARNARQLKILSALQTGNVELAQRADPPTTRASPTPLKTGGIAAVLGLVGAAILALIVDRVDRRLRSVAEAEAIVDAPLLGTVPRARVRRGDVAAALPPEPFRLVRSSLRYSPLGTGLRSVLITSRPLPLTISSTWLVTVTGNASLPRLPFEPISRRYRRSACSTGISCPLSSIR